MLVWTPEERAQANGAARQGMAMLRHREKAIQRDWVIVDWEGDEDVDDVLDPSPCTFSTRSSECRSVDCFGDTQ